MWGKKKIKTPLCAAGDFFKKKNDLTCALVTFPCRLDFKNKLFVFLLVPIYVFILCLHNLLRKRWFCGDICESKLAFGR